MNKEVYLKNLGKYHNEFQRTWNKIVRDTAQFKKDNPDIGFYSLKSTELEKLSDNLCLSGAWLIDRIENRQGFVQGIGYNRSLTKKIRKALGYSL